jgi:hypothetical protein
MSVDLLLDRVRSAGIRVWADGDKLRFDAPAGAVDVDLRARLRTYKSELLAILAEAAETAGGGPAGIDQRRMADRNRRMELVLRKLGPAAEEFRDAVVEVGLAGLLKAYGTSGSRRSQLAIDRPGLADRLGVAVDLLCLSKPVPTADAGKLIPDALIAHLISAGLATTDGDQIELPSLRLIEHYGQLLFTGQPEDSARNGYYGPDSAGLGRFLLGAQGRCLDAFAATGAQAAVMAATARSVVSVELDTALASVTELNIVLNGHLGRIEPRWGDINEVDLAEPFDTVSVNAPMSANLGRHLPWRADGGPDGCRVLEAALDRIRLSGNGKLFSTACVMGNRANGPNVDWLRTIATRKSWSVTVIPTAGRPLGPDSVLGRDHAEAFACDSSESVADILAALTDVWQSTNVDMLYPCLLTAIPSVTAGVTVASLSLRGAGWWL